MTSILPPEPTEAQYLTLCRSKSTRKLDEVEKLQKYQQHGVGEVWLMDTQRKTITVHDFTKKKAPVVKKYTATDTLTTPRMPGLEVVVGKVMG